MKAGDTWNESVRYRDALTERWVRRLTTRGRINQTPTYHTNSGFTADGAFLAFASVRDGATWILRARVETGELTALWKAPGIGDRNYIHRGMGLRFPDVDGRGISGNRVCMAPRSQTVVFTVERRILAVNIHSGRSRVILEDCGEEWIYGAPCVSPDETHVAIALSSSHPEMRTGSARPIPRTSYLEHSHSLRIVRLPLDGSGTIEVLYEHPTPAQSAHCAFCPTNRDVLYFDLDLPPGYWCGGDGHTPRIWLLDIPERTVRPLKQDYPGPFQTHQAWLWDGSGLCYHGPASAGGEYFGIAETNGATIWEQVFPEADAYGHHTPDPLRKALLLDGTFSTDKLQWLSWEGPTGGPARLEPICLHATDWRSLPGQYAHPHPLTDRTGQWVSFTSARQGRSDVYVVHTGS